MFYQDYYLHGSETFWVLMCFDGVIVLIFLEFLFFDKNFPGAINSNYNVAISIHLRPHAYILYLFFFWQHFKHVSFVF
jgi:hypothetical protein